MKVEINEDLCIGCGLCQSEAPDVFNVDGISKVIGPVDESNIEQVETATDGCPTNAIIINK